MFQLLSFAESFNSMLLEDRVEYITNKQGDNLWDAYMLDRGAGKPKLKNAAEVVKYLANNISEKHLQKIANWYQQGDFSLEDASKIKNSIEKFEKLRNKLEKKDLNKYASSAELDDALAPFNTDDEKSNKQLNREYIEKLFKEKQAELFYEGGGVKVIIPHTEEASKCFGKGTRWCTAANKDNLFNYYSKPWAPLYIVITDDGKKYQFHFATDQFMNAADQPVDLSELAHKYPVLYKIFDEEAKKWGVIELIDPKKLTNDLLAKIFENVRKAFAKHPIKIVDWINRSFAKSNIKLNDTIKNGLIELFDYFNNPKHVTYVSLLKECKKVFLKFEPMELIELAKKSYGYSNDQVLFIITHDREYVEHIYKDKKAFQELINFIVYQIKHHEEDDIYYEHMLSTIRVILGYDFDLKKWLPDGFKIF
jgi:hypothetical protein